MIRPRTSLLRWRGVAVVGAVVGASALTACSGGSSSGSPPTPPTRTARTTHTVPHEKGTTAPGTNIRPGRSVIVRFHPDKSHNSLISLTVTRVQKGSVKDLGKFTLPAAARKSSVYYVHARVKNTGTGNLSGTRLMLYGEIRPTLVVPPTRFATTFAHCNDQPLPKHFIKSRVADLCMVLLAPHAGTVRAVQWRFPDNVEPISWKLS
ncbi:MAG: hypothetical protein ACRDPG_06435 [Nocardioidaceae bacterium]